VTFPAANVSGSAAVILSPGTYVGGIHGSGKGSITLLPGLYYLKGGGLSVSGDARLEGDGVVIYSDGQSSSDSITLSGSAAVRLTPPTDGTYQGVTLFQARGSAVPVGITGTARLDVVGTVYAPRAPVTVSGNAHLTGLGQPGSVNQVIAYDLTVTGNGQVTAVGTYNQPLTVTSELTPTPNVAPGGGAVTRFGDSLVVGTTLPGAAVDLETGPDGGFDDGHATADAAGHFSIPVALGEGLNTLRVRAALRYDRQAFDSNSVTLDTHLTTPAFDLSLGSDTGAGGDHITSAGNVTLVGHTDPGETVTLEKGGATVATALASNTGTFQFAGVPLALGANPLTARVEDVAGNVRTFDLTLTRVAPDPNRQDVTLRWEQATLDAIRLDATAPPVASRALAMVSTAVFDAVSAVEGTPGYLVKLTPPTGASAEAAAAAAAHGVLSYLYPAQQAAFDATLAASLAQVPDGASKTAGVAFGRSVGDAVVALRANDGARDFVDYVPADANPGTWQPTPPAYAEALLPQFATVQPFALNAPDQFRPPAPPALGSAEYAAALNEVEAEGRATGSTRTPDETQIALFWADGQGTVTPPGHWNEIAMQLAAAQGNSLSANARLFAELNVALADAGITAWDAKYSYGLWRPITAIQQAGTDGNPRTTPDPSWTPFLVTPNFPTYVSGHSTYSGAAQVVLESFFGADTGFTATTESPGVAARTFSSFEQAAEEAGQSRIYAGIHFQFDNQNGLAAGRDVGDYVLRAFSPAADTRAPAVGVQSPAEGLVAAANVTVVGQVLDNLSGVKSLEVQIDAGNYTPLTLSNTGGFSVPTAFALDGSADGTHTLTFRATDFAGNVSTAATYTFTLDTAAPTLAITAPLDNDALTAAPTLTGTVSGTGSAITALSYAFDGGMSHSVVFDPATGGFSQALDLSTLHPGAHSLVVTARDAAGNTTATTLAVTLTSAIPLTVTGATPANGSADVGSTQRPKVTFSRPVPASSLSAANFYATDTTGTKLPASIVVSDDGLGASLFFLSPMPGASTITVTVDGSSIRAADDTYLDAAGTGTPGSVLTFSFTSVSLASLPGTTLTGILADPGPDLKPGTIDDVRRGPDGVLMTGDDVYLNPIEHVMVYVIGQETQVAYTDAQGRFTLNVPSGNVKLALQGMTATNAPAGYYFPEMVMDLTIQPGRVNTVMGSMGTREEATAMEAVQGVYLPRVRSAILQPVSNTAPTTITVPAEAAPDLTSEQRQMLTAHVMPGTAVGADGQVMNNVQVGISTVPPELIRGMLPQGVSEPPFTITVQAPGVVSFTTPVQLTYPNVDGSAPGTKLLFISFDHATGRLVVDGTATVSPDGKMAVTDPDSGLTHPGWHFVISGTPNRFQIGQRGGCGSGTDFLNADFPIQNGVFTPTLFENSLLYFRRANTTAQLEAEFRFYLQNVLFTGSLGQQMVDRFMGGTGQTFTHDVGSELSNLTKNSTTFKGVEQQVEDAIHQQIQQQANGGSIDNRNLSVTIPDISFGAFADGLVLKSLIGGTQGAELSIQNFSANATIISPDVGGSGSYSATLRFVICDDFGVDRSDLYAPPLAAFWLLQHERIGPKPFVNEIIVEVPIQGTFTVPPGYQDVVIEDPISTAPGFGTDPSVFYRYVLENGLQITGAFKPDQEMNNLVLQPNQFFTASFYQPSTNRSAQLAGVTSPSGQVTFFSNAPGGQEEHDSVVNLDTFGGPGHDDDDIPDIGEFVLGTDPYNSDSDGDGISDSAELDQGLDPLSGRSFPTGVVATLPIQGNVEKVAVDGDRIYAATGSYGLAVIDGTQFDKPTVLGQLDLPGTATGIGVDGNLKLAAVATGASLQIVDVSDGMKPKVVSNVNVPASLVEVAGGLAYAVSGTTLNVVDLASGTVVQTITLPGFGAVTGFAREGIFLYAFVSGSDTFSVIDIANEGAAVGRGQVHVDVASGDVGLFVGNGIAWLSGSGLRTIDVSNPVAPTVIATPSGTGFFTARRIALNGSGLGLLLPDGNNFLQVYDTSDPNNVANLLLQLPLSTNGRDVAISRGLAYVAEGDRIEVVNYLPFDNQGVPPAVNISTTATDVDLINDGLQVFEGADVPVRVNVTDDRQVRNVELLVNGQVVSNDVSFPFDFFAVAPQVAPGATSFTVQVRATDTGGNVALSNVLTIGLVTDTSPPTITSFVPPTNSSQIEPIQTVQVRFSKPMDPATVTATTVTVKDSSGNVLTPTTFQLRDNDRLAELTFPPLLVGSYQIVVSGGITDRAGNELSTTDVVSPFTLTPRASLGTTVADADPVTPGFQVFEGTTLPLDVTVAAGVSVQKVELLVNGQIVATDTTAPYQFSFIAPNITPGATGVTLQAKVTDTAGLATFTSPPLDVGFLEDVTPPTIVGSDPADGGSSTQGIQSVRVNFSEPLAPGGVTVANFQLFEAGPGGVFDDGNDVLIPLQGVQLQNDDTQAVLTTAPLPTGTYRLILVDGQGITDRAGNALAQGTFTSTFTLQNATVINFDTGPDPRFTYSGISFIGPVSPGSGYDNVRAFTGRNIVAFNPFAASPSDFRWVGSGGSTFNLVSFAVAGAWGQQTLLVQGFEGGVLKYSSPLFVTTAPVVFTPNWSEIDDLRINIGDDFIHDPSTSGDGQHWALANLTIGIPL
jgi:hypothetical protein